MYDEFHDNMQALHFVIWSTPPCGIFCLSVQLPTRKGCPPLHHSTCLMFVVVVFPFICLNLPGIVHLSNLSLQSSNRLSNIQLAKLLFVRPTLSLQSFVCPYNTWPAKLLFVRPILNLQSFVCPYNTWPAKLLFVRPILNLQSLISVCPTLNLQNFVNLSNP